MKNPQEDAADDELRPEYDLKDLLRTGIQGKYVESYKKGINVKVTKIPAKK